MNVTKKLFRVGVGVVVVAFVAACQLGTLPQNSAISGVSDPTLGPVADLPADTVLDTPRGGSFAFETYVSVGLDLQVESVAAAELDGAELAETTIIATVTNPEGDVLLRTLVLDGELDAAFGVTTATSAVTLTLGGVGIHERSIVIENPAELATISREMTVSRMSAVASRSQGLIDSDGDGVPDVYDSHPHDDTITFENFFPSDRDGVFTVAFEDNFPSLGDGDYNDFVAEYNVRVRTIGDDVLTLGGSATALAKVAGYDHEFGLMFRVPGASGAISVRSGEVQIISAVPFEDEIRIPLFASTAEATRGGRSTVTYDVVFNSGFGVSSLPEAPFDPYLYIKDTNYDVHLIGQLPLGDPMSRTPVDEDFRDADGFPRALLVPNAFAPPRETTSILDAYPEFGSWVAAEGGLDEEGEPTFAWYNSPNPDLVMNIRE